MARHALLQNGLSRALVGQRERNEEIEARPQRRIDVADPVAPRQTYNSQNGMASHRKNKNGHTA